jgi:hypothetical protein
MADKKTFLLRLNKETFQAIEKWAADEFRSVNGQLEWLIHRMLKEQGRLPGAKDLRDVKQDRNDKTKE